MNDARQARIGRARPYRPSRSGQVRPSKLFWCFACFGLLTEGATGRLVSSSGVARPDLLDIRWTRQSWIVENP